MKEYALYEVRWTETFQGRFIVRKSDNRFIKQKHFWPLTRESTNWSDMDKAVEHFENMVLINELTKEELFIELL